ncbi:MAG TPA: glycosyltransferase, partial [Polyangiaceae bacterium]|nr:glycosyltransferase [Polyangiaceae bacterium]
RDVTVECWAPERRARRRATLEHSGVPYSLFPSLALGYEREVSPSLLTHFEREARTIDAVFLHGSVSYLSALLLRRFGHVVPIIVQNHGETSTLARAQRYGRKKPLDYSLRVRLERRAFSKASRILCLNPENIEDYVLNGVAPERLMLSAMGVDLDAFGPLAESRQTLRAALGLPANAVCLAFVGRLAQEKRVDRIFALMQRLPSDHHLLVIGGGPEDRRLRARGAVFGDRVHFIGEITDRVRLNRYYNASDLLVLASEREGLGMVLLESLAAGVPVVASNLPGPRSVLEAPSCGLSCDTEDPAAFAGAVQRALSLPRDLSARRARAARYSWQSVCDNHAAILESLPRRRGSTA